MTIRPAGMTLERALEIATRTNAPTATPTRKRAPKTVPTERADLIRRMHADGAHDGLIAATLGMQRRSAAQLRRVLGLAPNPGPRPDAFNPVQCRRGHRRTAANQYNASDGTTRCRDCRRETERGRPRKPRNTTNQKEN